MKRLWRWMGRRLGRDQQRLALLGKSLVFLAGVLAGIGVWAMRAPAGRAAGGWDGVWFAMAGFMALTGRIVFEVDQWQAEMARAVAWLQAFQAQLVQVEAPLNAETVRPLGAALAALFPDAAGWVLLLAVPGVLVRGEVGRHGTLEVVALPEETWDTSALESRMRGLLETAEGPVAERQADPGHGRRAIWLRVRRTAAGSGLALAVVLPRRRGRLLARPPFGAVWDAALAAVLAHLELLERQLVQAQAQLGEAGFGLRVRVLVHELSRELQTALLVLAKPLPEGAAEIQARVATIAAYTARAAYWVRLFRDMPFTSGAIPLAPRPLPLAEVIDDALAEARLAWPETSFQVKGRLGGRVRADARLNSVLRNVLFNAASFCPEGAVRLSVSRVGREMRLRVEDDGPGVSRDQAEAIFEAGVALDQPERGRGMGVGLTIAREIARAYGGDLRCHPREEGYRGGCFEVRLRIAGEEE